MERVIDDMVRERFCSQSAEFRLHGGGAGPLRGWERNDFWGPGAPWRNPALIRFAKLGLKAAAALAALVILAGVALLWCGRQDRLIPAEVVVVPGNEVYRDGRPAPRLAARLDKSLELYRYGYCRTIIVSGGVGRSRVDEAQAMAAYLKARGVPERDIVVDSRGVNTWHTALFTADYLKKRRLDSVIVVSQDFHLPRSVLALEKAGCAQVGRAASDYREWRDVYSTLREVAAIVFYWWRYPAAD